MEGGDLRTVILFPGFINSKDKKKWFTIAFPLTSGLIRTLCFGEVIPTR